MLSVRHALVLAGSMGAALALTPACSFVLNFGADQCEVDLDCRQKGDSFADSVCVDNVCVFPTVNTGGSGTGGETSTGCVSNTQCVEDNGGLPYHCVTPGEECVSLLSEDCTEIFPPDTFNDDNALVIGYAADITGGDITQGQNMKSSVTLALDDLQKSLNGLPIGADGERRPMMAVICDQAVDNERAVSHLVDNLEVDAVICGGVPNRCLEAAQNVTIPSGTLMLTWHGSVPYLDIDDQGLMLLYRIGHRKVASLYPMMLEELEAEVRADLGMQPTEDVRLAALHVPDIALALFQDEIDKKLVLNGEPILNQLNTNYRRYEENDLFGGDAVTEIVNDFQPHIILLGWPIAPDLILETVESQWPNGVPKPQWWNVVKTTAVPQAVDARPDLANRIRGMWTFSPYPELLTSYEARYSAWTDGLSLAVFSEAMFDATYQLAYSYVIKRNVPNITGTDLADGIFQQNSGGVEAVLDPTLINQHVNILKGGGEIDVRGASGDIQFDKEVGDQFGRYESYCIVDQGDGTFDFAHANQFFDVEQLTKTGDFCCPGSPACP